MSFHPIKHFCLITHHRHLVMRHCFRAGIGWQGLTHDLSKYAPTEFLVGAKYYLGNRSPNVAERNDKGYSEAWMHHKGRNRHHFEYWRDQSPVTRKYEPVRMPLRFVIEMFCDRVAASKVYQGKDYTDDFSLAYLHRGHDKPEMHPDTYRLLEYWLTMLAEKGEKETFAYLRSLNPRGEYPPIPEPGEN